MNSGPGPHLMDRELAALYPHAPRNGQPDEDYILIDTEREFRVIGDRHSEWGFSRDDDGIYALTKKQIYHDLTTEWTSNSVLPCEVYVALHGSHNMRDPFRWVHPAWVQWGEWRAGAGFVVDSDSPVTKVTWDEGRSWIAADSHNGLNDLAVMALVAWMQFTPRDIVDSISYPPGNVGLVPFRRFEQISVAEALAWRRPDNSPR